MNRWTLARLLAAGFGLMLALLLGLLLYALHQQRTLADLTQRQYEHPFMVSNAMARADANIVRIRRAVGDIVMARSDAEIRAAEAEIAEYDARILADIEVARERYLGPKDDVVQMSVRYAELMPLYRRVVTAKREGDAEGARQLLQGRAKAVGDEFRVYRLRTYEFALGKAASFQADALRVRDAALVRTAALGIAALVLGLACGMAILRRVHGQLGGDPAAVAAIVKTVAGGDLDVRIALRHGDGASLLHAVQGMVAQLAQAVAEVSDGARGLAGSSEQMRDAARLLSRVAEEQAEACEQASGALSRINASIREAAEQARVTDELATQTAGAADRGEEAVRAMVDALRDIAKRTDVVDEIAGQTHLLAVNAFIEAADAGDAGRRFRVIAGEVRRLAEHSQLAARDIGQAAGDSTALADSAGAQLRAVLPGVGQTSALVKASVAAGAEQAQRVAQVDAAVGRLRHATRQSATAAGQLATMAEELNRQAGHMRATVAYFKLADSASRADAALRPRPWPSA